MEITSSHLFFVYGLPINGGLLFPADKIRQKRSHTAAPGIPGPQGRTGESEAGELVDDRMVPTRFQANGAEVIFLTRFIGIDQLEFQTMITAVNRCLPTEKALSVMGIAVFRQDHIISLIDEMMRVDVRIVDQKIILKVRFKLPEDG